MKKLMTMLLLFLTVGSAMGQDAKETYMKGVLALNAQNYELAAMYFESAANENVPDAQLKLGGLYMVGYGVEKSPQKAVEWYERAARLDYAPAQYALALSYINGVGVEKDDAKAIDLIFKAAQHDFPAAQWRLSTLYENGWGLPKDAEKAAYWKKKYEENKDKAQSQDYVNGMKKEMEAH